MPKPTFYRLAEEKRTRLIKAAYDEFTRAPFATASISNIIKDAGIPRGSFYQYFDDKADVYFYLLERMKASADTATKEAVEAVHGDLFAGMRSLFDTVVHALISGPYAAFYRNIFMYMDFHAAAKMSTPPPRPHPDGHGEMVQYLMAHVDRTKLRVASDEDLSALLHQVMGLFMQTIGYYYNRQSAGEAVTQEQLLHRLNQMLDWLEHGVAKATPTSPEN